MNAFNNHIDDLARLEMKIKDEDKTCILLCSLPFSCEYFGDDLHLRERLNQS